MPHLYSYIYLYSFLSDGALLLLVAIPIVDVLVCFILCGGGCGRGGNGICLDGVLLKLVKTLVANAPSLQIWHYNSMSPWKVLHSLVIAGDGA